MSKKTLCNGTKQRNIENSGTNQLLTGTTGALNALA
jgi:hypothetical protein